MLNLIELMQFVAFDDYGTLSRAAEQLHISQPTLTRSMRHVEDAFGVPLFHRGKNRIELNATGRKAVEYARKLLFDAQNAVQAVQEFDRRLRMFRVESCAPAPLWSLLPALSSRYPENVISSKIVCISDVIANVSAGQCDIGILPHPCPDPSLCDFPYIREKLSICIPKSHPLSSSDQLTFDQINGFNCLLRDQIGFWSDLCRQKMPSSRFLIQNDEFEFYELVQTSTLFCFATDLSLPQNQMPPERNIIPITDSAADITYHLICHAHNSKWVRPFALYDGPTG